MKSSKLPGAKLIFFAALLGILFPAIARADVIWTITGDDTDQVVSWSISGDLTLNAGTGGVDNAFTRFPTASTTTWDQTARLGTGGILTSPAGTSWAGDFSIRVNGGADIFTGSPQELSIVNSVSGDYIALSQDITVGYPLVFADDVIAYSGSGTFDLGAGNTKGDVFVDGTYIGEPLDHVSDRMGLVVQSTVAVPEPNTFAFLVLGGLGMRVVAYRRKKNQLP